MVAQETFDFRGSLFIGLILQILLRRIPVLLQNGYLMQMMCGGRCEKVMYRSRFSQSYKIPI
jgi:hypothetical protein